MRKITQRSILFTSIFLLVTTATEAQMTVDKNEIAGKDSWVVTTSAQTLLPAFAAALGEVTISALAGEGSLVSQIKLGDKITIATSKKEFYEVVGGKELPPVKMVTTQITYEDEEGGLMVKMFQEETAGVTGTHSLTNDGLSFASLIDELNEMGIKISDKTTLTRSSITLIIPLQLLRKEGLYESFKASEVYKSAGEN